MPETLLTVPEVHEFLGVKTAPREVGVNIQILNALNRRWLDREDVLRWLATNAESLDSALLERLHRELSAVTQGDM